MGRLEESKFFKSGNVSLQILADMNLGSGMLWLEFLGAVDLAWLARRNNPEPFAAFQVEGGLEWTIPTLLTKCADMRLQGHTVPFFIVVPKGRQRQIRAALQSPGAQVLIDAVPGLNTTRVICEENIDYLISDSKVLNQLSMNGLELLYTISESVLAGAGGGGAGGT